MKKTPRFAVFLATALISTQSATSFVHTGYFSHDGIHQLKDTIRRISHGMTGTTSLRSGIRKRRNINDKRTTCKRQSNGLVSRSSRIRQHLWQHGMVLEGDGDFEESLSSGSTTTKAYLREILTSPIVEVQLAALVLSTSVLAAVSTLQGIPEVVDNFIIGIENVICGIFAFEYLARWYLSGFSWKHFVKPLVLVDLIAIAPLVIQFMPSLGFIIPPNIASDGLVSLRLLRLLRLQRVLEDYESFCRFTKALGNEACNIKPYQLQLARVVLTVFTLLSISSALIYSAEHTVNPQIPDFLSALYFGLTTLTTVGFGDIYPMTTEGRFIVATSILVGVTVIPYQSASLAEALLDSTKEERELSSLSSSSTNEIMMDNNVMGSNAVALNNNLPTAKSGKSIFGEECEVCNSEEPGLVIEKGRLKLRTNIVTTKENTSPSGQTMMNGASLQHDNSTTMKNDVVPSSHDASTVVPSLANGSLNDLPASKTTNMNDNIVFDNRPIQQQQQQSPLYRICSMCGSAPHRADAGFCWGCGSPLPPVPASSLLVDHSNSQPNNSLSIIDGTKQQHQRLQQAVNKS